MWRDCQRLKIKEKEEKKMEEEKIEEVTDLVEENAKGEDNE